MAIATWQDLCIDAVDARMLGHFWADALGLTFKAHDDGDAQLDGPTPEHRVWVNTVPEPVTVKQRVHLDVHAGSVDEVLALGATPEDLDSFRWKVLRDPEGGELCVFERPADDERLRTLPALRDRRRRGEPRRDRAVVGRRARRDVRRRREQDWAWVEADPGSAVRLHRVRPGRRSPRPSRTGSTGTCRPTTSRLLLDAGATILDRQPRWTVMADPEGNEFCAFVPREG